MRAASDDAALCATLTRRHARTFALASRFLPAEKRRAAFAVYAFCRVADDIVDEPAARDPIAVLGALERHRDALLDALHGRACPPAFRELAWAARRFAIPPAPMHQLLDTLRADVDPQPIARWEQLARYCEGVASTVGTMCAHVFGLPSDPAARRRALVDARTLGVAMQLTNILRDVGEDATRGRCYLPDEDLAAFGIARDEVLARTIPSHDARWRALMAHEVARARSLYAAAEPGLTLIPADARCCALVCARGYAAILDAIERMNHDCLHARAHAGVATKLRIVVSAWQESRRMSATPARVLGLRQRSVSS
ncbi:MAG: phytoene/squalene synthase family protein [Gemmatirosa sp.]|nr:phytoene/squalene synthase family protein [Gemmatirosa sp.]